MQITPWLIMLMSVIENCIHYNYINSNRGIKITMLIIMRHIYEDKWLNCIWYDIIWYDMIGVLLGGQHSRVDFNRRRTRLCRRSHCHGKNEVTIAFTLFPLHNALYLILSLPLSIFLTFWIFHSLTTCT